MCLFHETPPQEQFRFLVPFIREGLCRNERVLLLLEGRGSEQLLEHLSAGGMNVRGEMASGRLATWNVKDRRSTGESGTREKIQKLGQAITAASAEQLGGIRVVIEATWILGRETPAKDFEEWKRFVNRSTMTGFPCKLLSIYSRHRLSAEVILGAIRTHPAILLGDEFRSNPFFDAPLWMAPSESGSVIGEPDVEARVDWLFSRLGQWRETESRAVRRLAAIVESSDDAIVSKDLNGIIQSWNRGAEQIFGYSPDEVTGKHISILIPPERYDEESDILRRIRRGERIEHYETIRRRKDGSLLNISLSVSPIHDSSGQVIGASKIARDITPRKRAEQQQDAIHTLIALINRSQSLPEIFEGALDAVCRCMRTSRSAILLFDESERMRFRGWRGLSDGYRRGVEGHSPWRIDDTDARPIWIEDIENSDLSADLLQTIRSEAIRALVFVPIRYDRRLLGKFMVYFETPQNFSAAELRPLETIATQVAFGIERRRSGEALEHLINQRTASLREAIAQMEEFSYSVSHDLRAPIRAMQGYAQTVIEDYGNHLDATGREYLQRVVSSAGRMDRLVQDILTYSRLSRREIELRPVSLGKVIQEVVQQYSGAHSAGAQIEVDSPLATVNGHETWLSQAVSNLLTNALKFVRPGTRPRIHIWNEQRNGHIRLWVEDNGIGIRPEHQSRLFGLFERIHPEKEYEGTGIGLAIVRRALERMGGSVGVESDGTHGSRFWIELPAANDP